MILRGVSRTFETTLATRWPDFDALGHLNHAAYHVYLDEARDDVLRQTVGDFSAWPNVLVHVSIDYVREIRVGTRAVVTGRLCGSRYSMTPHCL